MPLVPEATVAYFGPDRSDPAVRRRMVQWRHAGFAICAFAFSRSTTAPPEPDCVNLGRVQAQSRGGRVVALLVACLRLFAERGRLAGSRLVIARNLDNLFLALIARLLVGGRPPVVYEVLDINPSCTALGLRGALYRLTERTLLHFVDLLVVSSPHFVSEYFEKQLDYRGGWQLFENKVPKYLGNLAVGERGESPRTAGAARRWRVGWFGYLDDERSWQSLRLLASSLPDCVEIVVRGVPYTNFDARRFLADLVELPNVLYGGGFRNPEDLPQIYGSVDLVWAIDCNDLAHNSKWLLTNSLYEAGFFGVPVLALRGTAVGEYVGVRGIGWCLDEPIGTSLQSLIAGLDESAYREVVGRLRELGNAPFSESDEIAKIWDLLVTRNDGSSPVDRLADDKKLPAT